MFKNADLLFLQSVPDDFSEAIVESTTTSKASVYDHVALIEVTATNEIFVLHTLPDTGSIRESYAHFKTRDWAQIDLYRSTKEIDSSLIINQANQLLDQTYNSSYIPGAPGYYCADFVFEAFKHTQIFRLVPMNFMDPTHTDILPFWKSYYSKLGYPVPNGELGLNPNDMVLQNTVRKIKSLNLK
ncbi:YiiX/YebB-like N1pC/P60 family cysteine hydrolase [Pediococcus inopinatus]|uniref:YiiX/YebB-like N1pC/P60 family cysteine hydrolase n=1 Tax=Pediococcus inopinatus TaxID=114090 RepID=A0ABZ0Q3I1_9LACO|nr:YiiX/YebB-like N1pC/P60 family cysteine hydrolase [Pediococcus inopinatus]AVL00644.1 hypothetical protein PI20285_08350 [Pediococcus inopinatus]KRN63146.1 hypothetical protein IV83_GL001593 [Pediococcus inopinatus]WPC17044.1 YiiX/YebB-like N1pC/P60 family cysteine hydrolase [Pediococcus inopinatus]WPC19835.1 YiiX/YebB-like N1pC/P60 family cysteine hydrolase [Pediococcus inopinatus]WPC21535.1 YiiX/YebB-like N1pC/P60 family cysteine hydrolase [Pediococcus inopinatus]